jgi:hypothetical protein
MKIMFNDLDRPFGFLNLRYGPEIRKILCFVKHYSLTESERERSGTNERESERAKEREVRLNVAKLDSI